VTQQNVDLYRNVLLFLIAFTRF